MILVSKTFSTTTEESAAEGDFSETGYVFENVPYTFKELVRLMRDYRHPSCWPTRASETVWLSNDPDTDYRTGEETTESIHLAHGQPAHNGRYWRLAMVAAGVAK